MISILCADDKREVMTELLYRETTTLGIRARRVERECLPREIMSVVTEFGPVDVKVARFRGEIVNAMPEYNHVRRLAKENGVAFRKVKDSVMVELTKHGISAKAVSS